MKFTRWLMGTCLLCGGALASYTLEEDFKAYDEYSPAHTHWMFRGVGGEIHHGEYRFNGVALSWQEEGDVHPTMTMGQPRDFPAGNALKVKAQFTLGQKGFSFLENQEHTARSLGIAILNRQFTRAFRDPMNLPAVRLLLTVDAKGKQDVFFGCDGIKNTLTQKTVHRQTDWKLDGTYTFSLNYQKDTVSAEITDAKTAKTVYQASIQSQEFQRRIPKAYPAFVNMRYNAAVTRFKADNLDSAQTKKLTPPITQVSAAEIKATLPGGKTKSETLRPDENGCWNLAQWAGIYGKDCSATIRCHIHAPETGMYLASAQGDWWWKMDVNGRAVANFMVKGNGPMGEHTLTLPLEKGKNQIDILVKSGSAGWNFKLHKPQKQHIFNAEAKLHIYGADRVCWNLDRLNDDLNNLKKWDITMPQIATELRNLRRQIPATLGAWEAPKYDPQLDRFYEAVYNGYRLLYLRDSIRELKGLEQITGIKANCQTFAQDEKKLLKAVTQANLKEAERIAAEIQPRLTQELNRQKNWREGVSFGRNFGRFGWITGNKVGTYASGDGLLANQVLADGALLRQYVTNDNGKPWQLNVTFTGPKDQKREQILKALPTIGQNTVIEFGYDPTSFYSGATSEKVNVKDINWLHKKFAYDDIFVADMSLGSPALLLESAHDTLVLDQPTTSPFTHMAYRNARGQIVSIPLTEGTVYDLSKNGRLGRNWVCFWGSQNLDRDLMGHRGTVPVQVIFQFQPQKITLDLGKLCIKTGKNGAIWLNTPFGTRLQPAGNWWGNLPPAAVGRCDLHGEIALAYPVGMREFYRQTSPQNVEITNQFDFRYFTQNDWNLKPREYAAVPPVLALMATRTNQIRLPQNLVDLGYPTAYGPLQAVPGKKLSYTLPVPDVPYVAIPRNLNADPKDVKLLIKTAKDAIEGERFRAFCENIARFWVTLTFAPDKTTKSWQYLPQNFQNYLRGLFDYKFKAMQNYRETRLWRSLCEPYSGAKYFYSFSISCRQPGDVGVFGDRGYGVAHHFLIMDRLIAWNGNGSLLRKYWKDNAPLAPPDAIRDGRELTVDKMRGYLKNVHDWAWMDAGSNDAGDNGPVVDCGQAVFAGHAAYARMAQTMQDRDAIAKAAYYMAKSQWAEVARAAFTQYGRDNGVLGPEHLNVGFREFITPNSYANSPLIGKTPRNEYDSSLDSLFCYASQDGFDIFVPYVNYIWQDLRHWEKIRALYWPNRDRGNDKLHVHLISRLPYLLADGMPQSTAREMLSRWTASSVFWITKSTYWEILPLLMTGGCPLTLNRWAPVPIPDFTFDPSQKKATLTFQKLPDNYAFTATASVPPREIRCNGKPLTTRQWTYDPQTYRLKVNLPAGENATVDILFDRLDEDRFTPFAVPPRPHTIPPAPGLEPSDFNLVPLKDGKPLTTLPKIPKRLYGWEIDKLPKGAKAPAQSWYYHRWNHCKAPKAGGWTGFKPQGKEPANALKINAVGEGYAGWVSPAIPLPKKFSRIILKGTVSATADYAGNRPEMFFWTGKPAFFRLPRITPGEQQDFCLELTRERMGNDTEILIQMISMFDQELMKEPKGAFYVQNLVLAYEE